MRVGAPRVQRMVGQGWHGDREGVNPENETTVEDAEECARHRRFRFVSRSRKMLPPLRRCSTNLSSNTELSILGKALWRRHPTRIRSWLACAKARFGWHCATAEHWGR